MRKIPFIVLLLLAIMAKCSADVWQIKVKDLNNKWHTQTISKAEYSEIYKDRIGENIEKEETGKFFKSVHTEISSAKYPDAKRIKLVHYHEEPKK